jgi:hypothetical protein
MELFLWLYFYDNRWLFNIRVPVKIYKYVWFLPIFLHSILISVGIYYLEIADNFRCDESLRIWLLHRILFSFLICLNMIVFMLKIQQAYEKENSYFERARRAYPVLNNCIHEYDYWIRRNSLFSTSGVLLLIQGFISLFWSYMITALYKDHYYSTCDIRLQQVLNIHSILIWYCNVVLLVIFSVMSVLKVFFYLTGSLHPKFIIRLSQLIHRKKSNLKVYFHNREEVRSVNVSQSKKLEITF